MKFDILGFLESLSRKIQVSLKSDKTLHEDQHTFLRYLAHFFLEWEMFLTNVVEKIKTLILYAITRFWKSCLSWDNVEKYRPGQATDDNMAQARCMLDN